MLDKIKRVKDKLSVTRTIRETINNRKFVGKKQISIAISGKIKGVKNKSAATRNTKKIDGKEEILRATFNMNKIYKDIASASRDTWIFDVKTLFLVVALANKERSKYRPDNVTSVKKVSDKTKISLPKV